jgi:hypothetical protein
MLLKRVLQRVMDGCKRCGAEMWTEDSPLIRRTCEDCKRSLRQAQNSKLAAHRKAARHAALIARKCANAGCRNKVKGRRQYCSNACRQEAWRGRNEA